MLPVRLFPARCGLLLRVASDFSNVLKTLPVILGLTAFAFSISRALLWPSLRHSRLQSEGKTCVVQRNVHRVVHVVLCTGWWAFALGFALLVFIGKRVATVAGKPVVVADLALKFSIACFCVALKTLVLTFCAAPALN